MKNPNYSVGQKPGRRVVVSKLAHEIFLENYFWPTVGLGGPQSSSHGEQLAVSPLTRLQPVLQGERLQ